MLAVTAIGMVTSLGLDAMSSCAAARASIVRPIESDDVFLPDEEGVLAVPVSFRRVPVISAGSFGLARRTRLGVAALADMIRSSGPLDDCRVGFILLAGSDIYSANWARRARRDPELAAGIDLDQYEAALRALQAQLTGQLAGLLAQRSGLAFDARGRKTVYGTAVGLVGALRQAEEWISARACDCCVIGAVDSLIDPTTLHSLSALGLLKEPEQPVGLIPGEAAAFIVVDDPRARARRATTQAMIEAYAASLGAPHPRIAEDAKGDDGLWGAVSQVLAAAKQPPAIAVVSLNGDPYRSQAWGNTVVRPGAASLRTSSLWIPALSFGDTGAATGLASIALLARGWARGYAPGGSGLVCLMDDVGGRAAISVSRPS